MKNLINSYGKAKALLFAVLVATCADAMMRADDAASQNAASQKWELPAIVGDQHGWDNSVANNWMSEKGNPWTSIGASWSVVMQPSPEPGLTDEFKPMVDGLIYNFVHAWVDGSNAFDPAQFYLKRTLTTMSSGLDTGKFPENSKSSAIIFKPSQAGTYHVEISGTAGVQMKSAGYVSICIYTLKDNRANSHLINRQLLGEKDGYGDYPNKLDFDQKIDFSGDEELVVRIQTISPGQAPAGHGSISFDKFTVTAGDK